MIYLFFKTKFLISYVDIMHSKSIVLTLGKVILKRAMMKVDGTNQ